MSEREIQRKSLDNKYSKEDEKNFSKKNNTQTDNSVKNIEPKTIEVDQN